VEAIRILVTACDSVPGQLLPDSLKYMKFFLVGTGSSATCPSSKLYDKFVVVPDTKASNYLTGIHAIGKS